MNYALEPERTRHRRWIRSFQFVALSALLVVAVTWTGSVYDYPLDTAVMAGMVAPECAGVRSVAAGSLLPARQPDDDICRSFFLYRTTSADATDNTRAYITSIGQDRTDEFTQLIGYVSLLSLMAVDAALALTLGFRAMHARYRHAQRR